ncbi:MAG: TM2 domain-containing protein [Hominenteromicrobium sp.]
MTDFNDNNIQNTTPAPAQPEPAAQPAPAVPELTVDPMAAAEQIARDAEAIQNAEVPQAPEMNVPPVQNPTVDSPFTEPAPQYANYQQPQYQPPQYTAQSVQQTQPTPPQGSGEYQPPRYTQQYQPPQQPYQQPYQNPYQQTYQQPYQAPKTYTQKSRIAAAMLGIMFGTFGVHNFYQGRVGIGVAQLAITVVSCGWLSPVSLIWGLVEGIQLLQGKKTVDGHGLPFVD